MQRLPPCGFWPHFSPRFRASILQSLGNCKGIFGKAVCQIPPGRRFFRQYRANRQDSLTRDFSSEKGVKPQEYFVYFKVLLTHFWRKRSVRIRRRICAVLPYIVADDLERFMNRANSYSPAKRSDEAPRLLRCQKNSPGATPRKTARGFSERFFVGKRHFLAGILCVFQEEITHFRRKRSDEARSRFPWSCPKTKRRTAIKRCAL